MMNNQSSWIAPSNLFQISTLLPPLANPLRVLWEDPWSFSPKMELQSKEKASSQGGKVPVTTSNLLNLIATQVILTSPTIKATPPHQRLKLLLTKHLSRATNLEQDIGPLLLPKISWKSKALRINQETPYSKSPQQDSISLILRIALASKSQRKFNLQIN